MARRCRPRPVRGEGSIPPVHGLHSLLPDLSPSTRTRAHGGSTCLIFPTAHHWNTCASTPSAAVASAASVWRSLSATSPQFGFANWPRLVRHVQATDLRGVERALALADPDALQVILDAEPGAATRPVGGIRPLILLLRDTSGSPTDVRRCAELHRPGSAASRRRVAALGSGGTLRAPRRL